jgi:hypothetical protein
MQFREEVFKQKIFEKAPGCAWDGRPIVNDEIIEDAFWETCPEIEIDLGARYVFYKKFLPRVRPLLASNFIMM